MNLGGTIRLNKIGVAIICGTIVVLILYMTPRSRPPVEVPKVSLKRLLVASIAAAEYGGKEVVQVIKQANLKQESKGETKEGVNVPVTNADYKSHCVMYYGITKAFPMVQVISEEKERGKECQGMPAFDVDEFDKNLGILNLIDTEVPVDRVAVWIDPLDATKEYTEELYQYVTTMVCVAYMGIPVIGVIHRPFGPEPKTTWAWYHNSKSPHLRKINLKEGDKKLVDNKIIIVSRSHQGSVEKLAKDVFGEEIKIISAGGAGYKALEVAAGNVTAYLHNTDISKWDVCAGHVIVNSVGGSFHTLDGVRIDYSSSSDHLIKDGLLGTTLRYSQFIDKLREVRKIV